MEEMRKNYEILGINQVEKLRKNSTKFGKNHRIIHRMKRKKKTNENYICEWLIEHSNSRPKT